MTISCKLCSCMTHRALEMSQLALNLNCPSSYALLCTINPFRSSADKYQIYIEQLKREHAHLDAKGYKAIRLRVNWISFNLQRYILHCEVLVSFLLRHTHFNRYWRCFSQYRISIQHPLFAINTKQTREPISNTKSRNWKSNCKLNRKPNNNNRMKRYLFVAANTINIHAHCAPWSENQNLQLRYSNITDIHVNHVLFFNVFLIWRLVYGPLEISWMWAVVLEQPRVDVVE